MSLFTQPQFSSPNQLADLRSLQITWLRNLFAICIVAISLIWFSEAVILNEITLIDRIAYPIIIVSNTTSLLLLQWKPQLYYLSVLGTVGIIVLYTITFLEAIIWGQTPITDQYNLVTFAQWFPLIYIIIFIFLKQFQAQVISISIYLFCLAIPTLVNAWLEREMPMAEQKFPYLLHMLLSHPIYIAVFVAVSTLQASFIQAKKKADQAGTDHLTNLANRRAATEHLNKNMVANGEDGSSTGVVLIDTDHFKSINDTFGHDVGDQVLIQIAQTLQQGTFQADVVARWGGEEFLAIIDDTTETKLLQVAEQFRHDLEIHVHPTVGQVTASFGVALLEPGESLDSLLKRADEALYWAKSQGRNRVVAAQQLETPTLQMTLPMAQGSLRSQPVSVPPATKNEGPSTSY